MLDSDANYLTWKYNKDFFNDVSVKIKEFTFIIWNIEKLYRRFEVEIDLFL